MSFATKEAKAIEEMAKGGHAAQRIIDVVVEAIREAGGKLKFVPRNLTAKQLEVIAGSFERLGLDAEELLETVRQAARWAMEEYEKWALATKPVVHGEPDLKHLFSYDELLAHVTPLNQAFAALMGFDTVAAMKAANVTGTALDVAQGTAAAAERIGSKGVAQLAAIEHVLDVHHPFEQRWLTKEQFGKVLEEVFGWRAPGDMYAVAIPVDIHQRNLGRLAAVLNETGMPSPSQAAEFGQVTRLLQDRILEAAEYDKLSEQARASKRFFRVAEDTKVSDLVAYHMEVYGTEPTLKWLDDIVRPELERMRAALTAAGH